MRGLEEIRDINEDPSSYHRRSEPQHGHYDGTDDSRSFESNLRDKRLRDQAEARQAERGVRSHEGFLRFLASLDQGERVKADHAFDRAGEELANAHAFPELSKAESKAADAFFKLLLLDIIAHAVESKPKEPEHQERIHSAIDHAIDAPFMTFWATLNSVHTEIGQPEVGYGKARRLFKQYQSDMKDGTFLGMPLPPKAGAVADAGETGGFPSTHELDDPTTRFKADGVYQGLPIYRGEFKDDAGEWRRVHSKTGPIAYATPEAAIAGAQFARSLSNTTKS